MGQLSRILRNAEEERLLFWCPACDGAHHVKVGSSGGWQWDGDVERPTFIPSIRVSGHRLTRDAAGKWSGGWERDEAGNLIREVCHSFVTRGQIRFLGDCTHAFRDQTLDLPEWPRALIEDGEEAA